MKEEKKCIVYGKPSYQGEVHTYQIPEKVLKKHDFQVGDCCFTTNGQKVDLMIITKIEWVDKEMKFYDENGRKRHVKKVIKKMEKIPKYLQNLHDEIIESKEN